jgi:predicted double-glycine peptidase
MSRLPLLLILVAACTDAQTDPDGVGDKSDGQPTAGNPLGSVQHFIYTPLVKQNTEYTCGVAALRSVLHYYGVADGHEAELAETLGSDPEGGTSYHAMADYAKSVGLTATTETNMTIDRLASLIDRKQPVILAIQAWADDPAVDYKESFENGHYVVATGYDDANVYFMDPYTRASYTFIPRGELEGRWHDADIDGDLEHFGLIIGGKDAAFDFQQVLAMP